MSSQSVEYTRYAPVSSEWNIQLHIHSLAGPGRIYHLTHLRANGTPTKESYHIWANLGADQYCTVRHCIIAITHSTESWTGSHSKAGKGLEVSILISWYSTWTHAHWWSDGLVERFFVSRMRDFFWHKSSNLLKFESVLLSASVERVGVSRMRDFLKPKLFKCKIHLFRTREKSLK